MTVSVSCPRRSAPRWAVGFGARAVVIATGARYRRLDLPGLADLEGTGVYYAATLEEATRHADHAVAVVGGGNSADAVLPRPSPTGLAVLMAILPVQDRR
jgi:cation diffusion facilitator CzcD-associated flavoprotein CzcO